jgi:hypothetical protein
MIRQKGSGKTMLEVKVNRIASRLYQQLVTNHIARAFSETTKIAASRTDLRRIAKSKFFFQYRYSSVSQLGKEHTSHFHFQRESQLF